MTNPFRRWNRSLPQGWPALLLGVALWLGASPGASAQAAAGRYGTRFGLISFFSATPLIDIEAKNTNAGAVLDLGTGQMAVSVTVEEFQFERALMQQHFNESYMESTQFPKAIFTGKLLNYQPGSLKAGSKLTTEVLGELSMHGALRQVRAPAYLEYKNGRVVATTRFIVAPEDYKIHIPSIVRDHIAKSVDVSITLICDPLSVPAPAAPVEAAAGK